MKDAADSLTVDSAGDDLRALPVVWSIGRSARQALSIKLAKLNLEFGQDSLLCEVRDDGTDGVQSLAQRLRVKSSTISKSVTVLVSAGLLTRDRSKHDKRGVTVAITPLGSECREQVRQIRNDFGRDLTAGMTSEQIQDLLVAVDRTQLALAMLFLQEDGAEV